MIEDLIGTAEPRTRNFQFSVGLMLVVTAAVACLLTQWPFFTVYRAQGLYLPTPQFLLVLFAELWLGMTWFWWRRRWSRVWWALATVVYTSVGFVGISILALMMAVRPPGC